MPRIALLSNYPADHATCVGGVETATMGLLEGLQAFQGEFSFHVVTMPSSLRTARSERRDGFQFHFLSAPKAPWARPSLPFRTARAFRELRGIAPDLVHCQDNMALALASILSRRPRLFTVHGVKRHEAGRRTGREAWGARADSMLEPFVYRHFDRFVAISEYARDTVGSTDRSALIPNPVRSLFFEAHARRRPRPLLVFAGVLAPLKRPADLIAAYAQVVREVPELELVICGSVEDERYALGLRQQVADHGLQRVTFRGQTDQHEMAELLAQATALVLPSAQENAPMVIAEAMAVGVPVIASRVGGVPSLVKDDHTGWLYPAGSVIELTDRLGRLLAAPALVERFGTAARAIAEQHFHPRRVAAATVDLYREMLKPTEQRRIMLA